MFMSKAFRDHIKSHSWRWHKNH